MRFYQYTKDPSGTRGLCYVSCEPYHRHVLVGKWRISRGRSTRGKKIDRLTPPEGSLHSYKEKPRRALQHDYVSQNRMTSLELFCGTAGLSKALGVQGVNCTTLDHDPDLDPTYCLSIADLRRAIQTDTVPSGMPGLLDPRDIVVAAPDCRTFSLAAGGYHRNKENLDGHSREAEEANRMIEDLIFCLRYFRRRNPSTIVCIENPEGYMHMKYGERFRRELGLRMCNVSYCVLPGVQHSTPEEAADAGGGKRIVLPRKHTHLFTSCKNIRFNCKNNGMRCKNDCGVRDESGKRHQVGVYAYEDRMAAYPQAFCNWMSTNLTADLRAMKDC